MPDCLCSAETNPPFSLLDMTTTPAGAHECRSMPQVNAPLDIPRPDPLRSSFPLPLERVFFPLGFPVKISTNSEAILQAACEAWGLYGQAFTRGPLLIQFAVSDESSPEIPPPVLPRGRGNLISMVHSANNFAIGDLARGSAFGWFTPAVVSDRGYFLYHFLEAMVYLLIDALYTTPIHAACVSLEGAGVLLCGESGAGKTSLAYACARQGWTFLADDASRLLRKPEDFTIIGRPHHIRFRSSAAALFPELATRPAHYRASGKLDIEVPTAELGLTVASRTRLEYVVFLNRQASGGAHFGPYPSERALRVFEQVTCCGEEQTRAAQRASLSRLLEAPILELTYAGLDDAEHRLRCLAAPGSTACSES